MVEPQAAHRAWAEVVGNHVAVFDQLQKNLFAQWMHYLKAKTFFVTGPEVGQVAPLVPPLLPGAALAEGAGTPVLHMIHALHPDHLSPEIGQKRGAPGKGVYLFQGQDPDAV